MLSTRELFQNPPFFFYNKAILRILKTFLCFKTLLKITFYKNKHVSNIYYHLSMLEQHMH